MSIEQHTQTFPWSRYSKPLIDKILKPRSSGIFDEKEAAAKNMRLVFGSEGSIHDGNFITLYWLVDEDDGIIADCKYQLFGQSALIGAAEMVSEILIGKNYDQAKRITADLIDHELADKKDTSAFPHETFPHLNLVISAIEEAAKKCTDIPLSDNYTAPPTPLGHQEAGAGYPGWEKLPLKQKVAVIEEVLDRDIRPYIALDAGGVEVMGLENGFEVKITYQGSCTSCVSSVGATLSYIQQTLKNQVHKDLVVTPILN